VLRTIWWVLMDVSRGALSRHVWLWLRDAALGWGRFGGCGSVEVDLAVGFVWVNCGVRGGAEGEASCHFEDVLCWHLMVV